MLLRLFLLIFASATLYGQNDIQSIEIITPADWGKEIIQLPPGFAPEMKYRGTEDIRFAPGMFKPESDTFFTYVFLLSGKCGEGLKQKAVESEIMTYYKGLAKAVGGKKFKIDIRKFKISLESKNKSEYKATLDWVEPFKTGKNQKLNLKIYTWESKGKHFLFAMVSPAKLGSKVWEKLEKIKGELLIK